MALSAGTIVYFAVLNDAIHTNRNLRESFSLVMQGPSESRTAQSSGNTLLIVLLTCLLGGAMLAALALLVFRRRCLKAHVDEEAVNEFLRKRNPPQRGLPIVAVVTDIEASTLLWEWNPVVMKKALAIHQNVIRTLLPKYFGYESDTEGDSFTLVFHTASDALGWAMEAQRCLLYPRNLFQSMLPLICSPPSTPHKTPWHATENDYGDWPAELLSFRAGAEFRDKNSGQVLYRGLRVRMGIHVGVPEGVSQHPNGRQHYRGEVMDMAHAIQDASRVGGQVLLSMLTWQGLGVHQPAVVCHHMGLHEVGEKLPPVHLLEVLPEELVKRAPYKPLKSKQLSPSFFDAPLVAECYLSGFTPSMPMVIAFMYVGGAKALRRLPGYQKCVDMLVTFVQTVMRQFDAYEVEEKDGNFLLAFASAAQAAQFTETVHRDAMSLPWAEDVLEHEAAAEVVKPAPATDGLPLADTIIFRGLRLQIGLCMDVPSDCRPHMATGRAAYFGPIVNRAARIAATAAPGQTLANHALYEMARSNCAGLTFLEMGKFDLKVGCCRMEIEAMQE
eukprot:jgi/Mesvir1/27799/Mv07481-RA.2